jgi:LmbE family N-acetylglucosaminyl deacetylase
VTPLAFAGELREVLFLGAHCDDIEIGCGGTLASLAATLPAVHLRIVVFSGNETRERETRAALDRLLPTSAHATIEVCDFRDGFFPSDWPRLKERFEALKAQCRPDVVFTHYEHDRHQDHRTVCELTWNTFRNHTVLEYEIPKFDGDLGQPAVFWPLERSVVDRKIAALLESFPSQAGKSWFKEDLFSALLRIRGMECNSASGFAEAFYVRKLVGRW